MDDIQKVRNEGTITYFIALKGTYINDEGDLGYRRELYPAFTWQEILWEHTDKFFGDKNHYHVTVNNLEQLGYDYIATQILIDLMHKRYDKADLYFRQNCILIPQSTNE